MNTSLKNTLASFAALAAAAAAITAAAPASAAQPAAAPIVTPGGAGDYLVHVGKRPVWASTLRRSAAAPRPSASAPDRDYLVHVGKQPVWASTLPRRAAVASSLPPSCRDYPVTVGKQTVLASSLPQNRNVDGTARFCCVTNRDCPHGTSCCPA